MTDAAAPAVTSAGGRRDLWILAAIVLLAFGLRLVAVRQYEARHPLADHPPIDEASYDRWARAIAGGEWIGKEVFFQEPLYPYALGTLYAVAGPARTAARIAQCALWAATAGLVGWLARRLFGRAAGIVAAFAIALYGPGMLFPAYLLKENLLLPLFAGLALALVGTRRGGSAGWIAVGVLAGLGALLRGNLLAMAPLLVLWPLARAWRTRAPTRAAARASLLVLLGLAATLAPVAVRNAAVGGELLLTTSGAGTNLYGGNNLENPYGRATEFSFVRGIPEHEAGDWRREAERRLGRALSPGDVSAYWRGEMLRSFRAHPREHLAILANKLRLALGRYEVPDDRFLPWDARYVPLARAPWPAFGLVGVLGIAGIALFLLHARWGARWGRRTALVERLGPAFEVADRGAAAEVALLAAAYLATVVLTVVSDRARLPLVPLLAPFAAWTVVWGARAAWTRSQDALVQLALAVFLGALVVLPRVMPESEQAEDFAERDHNLAVELLRQGGRDGEARAIAERLAREHPASARSKLLLAEIDLRAGRDPAAILARVEPLADEPTLNERERFRARSLAAWTELRRGDFGGAERRFREALAFDGESRELREGLARALLARVDRAAAEEALAILGELRASLQEGTDPSELELATAQAEFARGRAILLASPVDDAERDLGRAAVQAALDRSRSIAESAPSDVKRRARLLAGGIQIYRGNWGPAENHFRAALAIEPDRDARLGLAAAILGGLEAQPELARDGRRTEEAQRLLAELETGADPDPRVAALQSRLRELTPPPPSPPR